MPHSAVHPHSLRVSADSAKEIVAAALRQAARPAPLTGDRVEIVLKGIVRQPAAFLGSQRMSPPPFPGLRGVWLAAVRMADHAALVFEFI